MTGKASVTSDSRNPTQSEATKQYHLLYTKNIWITLPHIWTGNHPIPTGYDYSLKNKYPVKVGLKVFENNYSH